MAEPLAFSFLVHALVVFIYHHIDGKEGVKYNHKHRRIVFLLSLAVSLSINQNKVGENVELSVSIVKINQHKLGQARGSGRHWYNKFNNRWFRTLVIIATNCLYRRNDFKHWAVYTDNGTVGGPFICRQTLGCWRQTCRLHAYWLGTLPAPAWPLHARACFWTPMIVRRA
jgi:hypothetical protein